MGLSSSLTPSLGSSPSSFSHATRSASTRGRASRHRRPLGVFSQMARTMRVASGEAVAAADEAASSVAMAEVEAVEEADGVAETQ